MWASFLTFLSGVAGPIINLFKSRSDLNNTPQQQENVEAQRIAADDAKNQKAVEDDLKGAQP